jgi:hypothetical protein
MSPQETAAYIPWIKTYNYHGVTLDLSRITYDQNGSVLSAFMPTDGCHSFNFHGAQICLWSNDTISFFPNGELQSFPLQGETALFSLPEGNLRFSSDQEIEVYPNGQIASGIVQSGTLQGQQYDTSCVGETHFNPDGHLSFCQGAGKVLLNQHWIDGSFSLSWNPEDQLRGGVLPEVVPYTNHGSNLLIQGTFSADESGALQAAQLAGPTPFQAGGNSVQFFQASDGKGSVEFFPDGKIKGGYLANQTWLDGQSYPSGRYLRFTEDGKVIPENKESRSWIQFCGPTSVPICAYASTGWVMQSAVLLQNLTGESCEQGSNWGVAETGSASTLWTAGDCTGVFMVTEMKQ